MALSYDQMSAQLDEIRATLARLRNELQIAANATATANATINGMAAAYGSLVTDVNAAAIANPGNAAYAYLKADKDALVAAFQALKTDINARKAAIDGTPIST